MSHSLSNPLLIDPKLMQASRKKYITELSFSKNDFGVTIGRRDSINLLHKASIGVKGIISSIRGDPSTYHTLKNQIKEQEATIKELQVVVAEQEEQINSIKLSNNTLSRTASKMSWAAESVSRENHDVKKQLLGVKKLASMQSINAQQLIREIGSEITMLQEQNFRLHMEIEHSNFTQVQANPIQTFGESDGYYAESFEKLEEDIQAWVLDIDKEITASIMGNRIPIPTNSALCKFIEKSACKQITGNVLLENNKIRVASIRALIAEKLFEYVFGRFLVMWTKDANDDFLYLISLMEKDPKVNAAEWKAEIFRVISQNPEVYSPTKFVEWFSENIYKILDGFSVSVRNEANDKALEKIVLFAISLSMQLQMESWKRSTVFIDTNTRYQLLEETVVTDNAVEKGHVCLCIFPLIRRISTNDQSASGKGEKSALLVKARCWISEHSKCTMTNFESRESLKRLKHRSMPGFL
ncbi:hypothetical protein NEOLI_001891 [Neolecta irregularis DAH-3]|uniref:Uncharacterized protein n=1 Tax=Neolecta irregularis (strain DAH-3) TaxID=1198029 RepID=A0A1U7LWD7_NEOID|nr:hypothetical protein NEOLI_001891 [Neolecta irregularis DAH-3]|eukprot:OLL26862.1 hypothetical protein NEOLI_001891 [Neolecta irregularis DAH-3]